MSVILILLVSCLFFLHQVRSDDSSFEYNITIGCKDKRYIPSDSCQWMAPADWVFGFELSMYMNAEDIVRSYETQRRMAHMMFNEMSQSMAFGPMDHRMAVLVHNGKLNVIKSLCNEKRPAEIKLPPFTNFTKKLDFANGITYLLDNVTEHFASCAHPLNVQRIVIAFVNFALVGFELKGQNVRFLTHILKEWQNEANTSTQVYVVAANDGRDWIMPDGQIRRNVYNFLHLFPQDFPINGNLYINSYFRNETPSRATLNDLSSLLLKCACHRSEDCSLKEYNRTECYFAWSKSQRRNEVCQTEIINQFVHQPVVQLKNLHTCTTERLKEIRNCSRFEECMPSCNQHKWGHWSRCVPTSRGVSQQQRQRIHNNRSRSVFTRTCKVQEFKDCTPFTSIRPPGTPDDVETTVHSTIEEEDTTTIKRITTAASSRIVTTQVIQTSTDDEPKEWTVMGLNVTIWAAICVAFLAIAFVLFVVMCITTHQRTVVKKRKLLIIAGITIPGKTDSDTPSTSQDHKKQPSKILRRKKFTDQEPYMYMSYKPSARSFVKKMSRSKRSPSNYGDLYVTTTGGPGSILTKSVKDDGHYEALVPPKLGQLQKFKGVSAYTTLARLSPSKSQDMTT